MNIETAGFSFGNLGFGTALMAAPAERNAADERALARQDWARRVEQRQRALSGRPASVPRLPCLPQDAFLDLVYAARRPVVIAGIAADWPAVRHWSRDHLVRAVGDAEITYQGGRAAHGDYELAKDRHTRTMPFDRYIAGLDAAGNDAYVTAYNSEANRTALAPLMADLGAVPYLTGADGMMWIGPAGTFTPLHYDLTNNFLVQLMGRKRLHLMPPDDAGRLANTRHVFSDVHDIEDEARLELYPAARQCQPLVADIGPGDALFIPVGWWHQVRSLEFSVMLTYTDFVWPNDAYADFPS